MKRIAVMQPYFFPYLGYFSLIKHTQQFILFDVVQMIRHGWIDRNRILKQGGGWLYINVPLSKMSHKSLIMDSIIDPEIAWQKKIMAQLAPYKRTAPYYRSVLRLVDEILEVKYKSITHLNKACLESVCSYIGMERSFPVFSEMNLTIEEPRGPDEWALNICKALPGVDEYWNPPGGEAFFDATKYRSAGINLRFHKINLRPYDQRRAEFEPGLSIIDVMMFNSPESIQDMLDDYELS